MASIGQTKPINISGLKLPTQQSKYSGMVNTGVYQQPKTELNLKTPQELINENKTKLQQQFGTIGNSEVITPPAPPKIETTISTKDMAKGLPATQVVDNSGLVKTIQSTLDKAPTAKLNEAGLEGLLKIAGLKGGSRPDLVGVPLKDAINTLKIGDKFSNPNLVVDIPSTIAPEATKSPTIPTASKTGEIAQPKTAFQDMEAFVNDYSKSAEQKMTELADQQGLETKSQEITQAEENLSSIDNQINAYNLDLLGQAEDIKNKPILLGDISQKLNALDDRSKINLMLLNSNRNKALADYNAKVGDYQRASEIVKESAADWKETQKMKLDLYAQKVNMDSEQKKELTVKNDDDFSKMEKGYVQITPDQEKKYEQDILSGKAEGSIYTDVYGQKWFKPKAGQVSEETKAELLSPTEAKALGVPYGTTKGQAMLLGITPTDVDTIGGLTKDQLSELNKIRSDMRQDPDIKEFSTVRDAYTTGKDAVNRKNSAGDIILMRMIAKITDPTTGVREEEFRTFEGAQGTLAKFGITLTKKMWGAGTLTEEGRKQLSGVMEDIYNRKKTAYDNANSFFANQGDTLGIPKNLLILDKGLKAKNYDEYYKTLTPDQLEAVDNLQRKNPNLSDEDFYQLILDQGVDFNDVGGDTNKAIVSKNIGGKDIKVSNEIASKLEQADAEMFKKTGKHISINQSFRTYEQQANLYKKLSPKGSRVAPPGKSFHEKGLAVDVSNWKEAEPYLRKYGLLNNLADDKGHFSFKEFA